MAGPFHPSFRELVEGSLLSDIILKNMMEEKVGVLYINPRDLSKLYANKKTYFSKLRDNGKIIDV